MNIVQIFKKEKGTVKTHSLPRIFGGGVSQHAKKEKTLNLPKFFRGRASQHAKKIKTLSLPRFFWSRAPQHAREIKIWRQQILTNEYIKLRALK